MLFQLGDYKLASGNRVIRKPVTDREIWIEHISSGCTPGNPDAVPVWFKNFGNVKAVVHVKRYTEIHDERDFTIDWNKDGIFRY